MENSALLYIYLFILDSFIGFDLINIVPATLHTPLMSGANAISGITLVGAILILDQSSSDLNSILGLAAVVLATVNVVGGFMDTDRMLQMFRRTNKNE